MSLYFATCIQLKVGRRTREEKAWPLGRLRNGGKCSTGNWEIWALGPLAFGSVAPRWASVPSEPFLFQKEENGMLVSWLPSHSDTARFHASWASACPGLAG